MTPDTTYLSLNILVIHYSVNPSTIIRHLFLLVFFLCLSYHPSSPAAKIGVASVAGVDTLAAASTSPHVGGTWVVQSRCVV